MAVWLCDANSGHDWTQQCMHCLGKVRVEFGCTTQIATCIVQC